MATLNLEVAANGDDTQFVNSTEFEGSNLYAGNYGGSILETYMRFNNVSGLSGGTINSATISLYGFFEQGDWSTEFRAERADSPSAPSDKSDYDGRTKTTAAASWDSGYDDSGFNDIDLQSVIQEIADNHDPSSILIFHEDDGSVSIAEVAYLDYENGSGAGQQPQLDIDYTAGGGSAVPVFAQHFRRMKTA